MVESDTNRGVNERPASVRELFLVSMGTLGFIWTAYNLINDHNRTLADSGFQFHSLHTPIDDLIRFTPEFAWFYYSYYLVVFAVAVLAYSQRKVLYEVLTGYALMTVVGWVSWLSFPVQMVRPDVSTCMEMSCALVKGMYEIDPGGYNVLPSLHTAHSVFVFMFFYKYDRKWSWFFAALGLCIIASTVFIKQHYFLDLPPGVVTGIAGYWVGTRYGVRFATLAQRTSQLFLRRAG